MIAILFNFSFGNIAQVPSLREFSDLLTLDNAGHAGVKYISHARHVSACASQQNFFSAAAASPGVMAMIQSIFASSPGTSPKACIISNSIPHFSIQQSSSHTNLA